MTVLQIKCVDQFVNDVNSTLRQRQDHERLKGIIARIESYDVVVSSGICLINSKHFLLLLIISSPWLWRGTPRISNTVALLVSNYSVPCNRSGIFIDTYATCTVCGNIFMEYRHLIQATPFCFLISFIFWICGPGCITKLGIPELVTFTLLYM